MQTSVFLVVGLLLLLCVLTTVTATEPVEKEEGGRKVPPKPNTPPAPGKKWVLKKRVVKAKDPEPQKEEPKVPKVPALNLDKVAKGNEVQVRTAFGQASHMLKELQTTEQTFHVYVKHGCKLRTVPLVERMLDSSQRTAAKQVRQVLDSFCAIVQPETQLLESLKQLTTLDETGKAQDRVADFAKDVIKALKFVTNFMKASSEEVIKVSAAREALTKLSKRSKQALEEFEFTVDSLNKFAEVGSQQHPVDTFRFNSLTVLPMQRFTRYPLLLKGLMDWFNPEAAPQDFERGKGALSKFVDGQRWQEMSAAMSSIQSILGQLNNYTPYLPHNEQQAHKTLTTMKHLQKGEQQKHNENDDNNDTDEQGNDDDDDEGDDDIESQS